MSTVSESIPLISAVTSAMHALPESWNIRIVISLGTVEVHLVDPNGEIVDIGNDDAGTVTDAGDLADMIARRIRCGIQLDAKGTLT